ncbi:MAG: hypothetical protein WCQ72_06940 [Eubacteriales bacterium]
MKLRFLGTGAADFDITKPSADINFRRFSSLLINDDLLVDPGPCIFEFADTFAMPWLYDNVKTVLNTHPHSDHFSAESAARLGLEKLVQPDIFSERDIGGYRITTLPANHETSVAAKHFIIEDKNDGKTIFYGCDGAWLPYLTYREIMKHHFDLMIFDGTIGEIDGDYRIFEHNNIRMVAEMKKTLSSNCGRFMISHLARTLHGTHAEAVEICKKYGIEVARDNLILDI